MKYFLSAFGLCFLFTSYGHIAHAALRAEEVSAPPSTFARDLKLRSVGADVTALQDILESKGFLTMPLGATKGYFGTRTRDALAHYQKTEGIVPAQGYFGPVTRAHVGELFASRGMLPWRIAGVWEVRAGRAESHSSTSSVELYLTGEYVEELPDTSLYQEATSGVVSLWNNEILVSDCRDGSGFNEEDWKVSGAQVNVLCGQKTIQTFAIRQDATSGDIMLVDEKSGQIFTRKPALVHAYIEEGKSKILTLYEIPGSMCHACGAELWGVFKEVDSHDLGHIVAVTSPLFVNSSYGRVHMDDTKSTSSPIDLGKNKKALIFSWNVQAQGLEYTGVWFLEYDKNTLDTPASITLGEDNGPSECDTRIHKMDSISGDIPCFSYSGSYVVDTSRISPKGYYDIVVTQKGTQYDSDKDKVVSANKTTRYVFGEGAAEYAEKNP